MRTVRRLALAGLLLLPGAVTAYTAFHGGGFFAGTQAGLVVLFALLLLLRATLAEDPFAGASAPLAVAAGALTLLAGWTLASSTWSDAPARALIEADRVLLYVLALVLFGTLAMTRRRLRVMVWGLGAGALVVCTSSLITRTLPKVWEVAPNVANERLAYPITYWNALGLLAALGIVLAVHLACSEREPRAARVVGAAAMPIFAATLYLTVSRASIGLCLLGIAGYLALARPRCALTGLAASLPPAVVAVVVAYGADELVTEHPATARGVDQGGELALVVGLCVLAGAVARLLLLRLDARIVSRPPRRVPLRVAAGVAAAVVVAGSAGFVTAGGPGYVGDQWETFVERPEPLDEEDVRQRLTDPSSNGRIPQWEVAADAWSAEPLHGNGAGTYETLWYRDRPDRSTVYDAHSLYLEVLGELGLVGAILLAVALAVVLGGAAMRIRGPDRALFAAVFTALAVWALHAGVDWDWEMPVVTLWVFCAGGAVLAIPRRAEAGAPAEADPPRTGWSPPRLARVLVGLGCLLLIVTPVRLMESQAHLNDAVAAWREGRCPQAVDEALASLEAIASRPEPRLVLTYCNMAFGRNDLALRQIREAVQTDPDAWNYRYVMGIVQARLGEDPRAALARARRQNPRDEMMIETVPRFAGDDPEVWERRAARAPVPGL